MYNSPSGGPWASRIAASARDRQSGGGRAVFALMIVFGLFSLFVVPVLAILAVVRTSRLTREIQALREETAALRAGLAPSAPPRSERPEAAAPSPEAATPAPSAEPQVEASTAPEEPARPAITTPLPPRKRFEELVTARWLVWLGAATIALAGTFLVKHAIDRDWLTPATRVALGGILGLLLIGGGEWLRRRPQAQAVPATSSNSVPAALTAAGLFTLFASLYAAHALYDLLHPLFAFAGLAGVAMAGLALALPHGPLVAVLGLTGGYATPLLVRTDDPSAISLFSYLLVITIASLALIRRRSWWALGAIVLAGAALWPLGWMAFIWSEGDAVPLGLYLIACSAGFLIVTPSTLDLRSLLLEIRRVDARTLPAEALTWVAALAFALLVFALVRMDGYGVAALAVLALWAAMTLGFARGAAPRDGLAVIAAIVALALFATWHLPEIVTRTPALAVVEGAAYGELRGPILPPELHRFAIAALVFAALFGFGGFAALWGAARPALWAGLSAGVPALLFAIGYWRFLDFALDLRWAAAALGLAGVNLLAVRRVERYRAERGYDAALGFYAAAVSALISLGAAMTLREAWLTVALAVQLPALGWIWQRIGAKALRVLAAVLAAVVLARLALNYGIFDYPLRGGVFNWVLYGYGIPAAMFFWAARLFRTGEEGALSELLRAGGLVFSVLLVTLEIRALSAGALDAPYSSLLEHSLQSLAWLTFAAGLGWAEGIDRIRLYAMRALTGAAVMQIIGLHLGLSNPIFTQEPVGSVPVFNLLLLAYAAPAALLFLVARAAERHGPRLAAPALRILAFVLLWAWLTLETRHAFQGSVMQESHLSDLEYYAYSMAWLAYAGALLALGIRFGSRTLRYASLAVLMATVAKVFIGDMAGLAGLYRVASFLLLGLSLVGIGWLYQRFVFPARAATPGAT